MKHVEHSLRRLFRAAGRARKDKDTALPVFLETRLMALWRSGAPEPMPLLPMFRLAAVCAILVMLLCVGWSWLGERRDVPGAAAFVNFEQITQIVP